MKPIFCLLYSRGEFVGVSEPIYGGNRVKWTVHGHDCSFDYTTKLVENDDCFVYRADQVSGPRVTRGHPRSGTGMEFGTVGLAYEMIGDTPQKQEDVA